MSQIINDDDIFIIDIVLNITARSLISVVGVVTNVVNMIIFISLGLKDSMSVGLFSLSFTDFLVNGFQFASGVCYVTHLLYPTNPIDVWSVGYLVFGFLISASYLTSCWITAMISVERCYCVVFPFKVKEVFTRQRCVISVLIIYAVCILLHVPVYVIHRMEWKVMHGKDNKSTANFFVFTATFNEQTGYFDLVFDLSVGIAAIFLAHVLTVICAVCMGYSLKASYRVRQHISQRVTVKSYHNRSFYQSKLLSSLSERERKLMKVVLCVGVIHAVSSLPKIATATVYHTIPGMNSGSQPNLSTTMWALTSAIRSLFCTANFFVYVILNTSFMRRLFQKFGKPIK